MMWVHYNASAVSVVLIRMLPGALVLPMTSPFCFALCGVYYSGNAVHCGVGVNGLYGALVLHVTLGLT